MPLHEKLAAYLEEINFNSLDLRNTFALMNHTRLVIEPGQDSHPNEIAQRVAAEKIFKFVREKKLVPDSFLQKKSIPSR
jgi:hypothetical protein